MKIIASKQGTGVLTHRIPQLVDHKILTDIAQVFLASCFIALCAQIEIPLFFTPVPLTGQAFGVMLSGAFLGSKKGTLAAFLYLLEGCFGFPVWAGGSGGLHHMFGPTGGYLLAYPLQTYLIGILLQRRVVTSLKTASVLFLSCLVQLMVGSLWLAFFVGAENMMLMGFYPFVLGDGIKAFIVTWYMKRLR